MGAALQCRIPTERPDTYVTGALTTTSSASGRSIAQPSDTAPGPTSRPTAAVTATPSPSSGLSTGATGGISIALVVVGLISMVAMTFMVVRRRKAIKMQYAPTKDGGDHWYRQELEGFPAQTKRHDQIHYGELYGSALSSHRISSIRKPNALVELE